MKSERRERACNAIASAMTNSDFRRTLLAVGHEEQAIDDAYAIGAHANLERHQRAAIELRRERDESARAANSLRTALLQACSMLDDAVQLRDDAEQWFPEIDKLRRVARPDLPVMAGYVTEADAPTS